MPNWIDITILILLVIMSVRGYWTGLIRQATTIIAIILGIYMAAEQYDVFAGFLQQKMNLNLQVANLISFAFIIITVSVIVNYLGQLINQMLDFLSLSMVDKIGGAVFGIVKGGLVIYIFILIALKLANTLPWESLQQQLDQSFFVPQFLELNPLLKRQIDNFLESGVEA